MELKLITGVTGKLGKAYLDHLQKEGNADIVSLTRRIPEKNYEKVRYLLADLLDKEKLKKELEKIDFSAYKKVTLIHPIGMFKFEHSRVPEKDLNNDGIDDDIYSSNILTFTNLFELLKKQIKKSKNRSSLVVCCFGSISDQYNIPFWNSYTKSKNHLRKLIKSAAKRNKLVKIRGVFVNVSTVDTGNERNLRPYAKRDYWLTPEEIVKSSIMVIENGKRKYTEINVYKENPNFEPHWYTNHENVLDRWEKQMKGGLKQNGN